MSWYHAPIGDGGSVEAVAESQRIGQAAFWVTSSVFRGPLMIEYYSLARDCLSAISAYHTGTAGTGADCI
jgi:hypothetical protein